jgi:hypothetical protein
MRLDYGRTDGRRKRYGSLKNKNRSSTEFSIVVS